MLSSLFEGEHSQILNGFNREFSHSAAELGRRLIDGRKSDEQKLGKVPALKVSGIVSRWINSK
jgi:hypothetical protein